MNLQNPHPFGCPWHSITERFGYPDVIWCEKTLCSWISEPANTWSNLAYIIVGLVMYWELKKDPCKRMSMVPWTAFAAGIFSFVWHASNFFYTQVLDFVGAFAFPTYIIALNAKKIFRYREWTRCVVFCIVLLVHVVVMIFFYYAGISVRLAALPLMGLLVISEIVLFDRSLHYHYLILSLIVGSVAVLFLNLDHSNFLCDPQNHLLQGHALWHVFSAFALYLAYRHYWWREKS